MPQEFEPHSFSQDALSPSASGTPDPAMQRVTPEELQTALGALEGRSNRPLPAAGTVSDAAHVPGTLSIGEAADALGLSIPADELWQEVQAQRSQKEKAERERAERAREQAERAQTRQQPPPFGQVPPLGTSSAFVGMAGKAASVGRRRGGFRWWIRLAVAIYILSRVVAGHGGHHIPSVSGATVTGTMSAGSAVTLRGDATTAHYVCKGGTLTVNGDADTVTLDGHLDRLIINGDADTVQARGPIKTITLNGDANTVRYPSASAPVIDGGGSANSARPE